MSSERLWASIGCYTGTRITTFPTVLKCHARSHVTDGTISLGNALIFCLFFQCYAAFCSFPIFPRLCREIRLRSIRRRSIKRRSIECTRSCLTLYTAVHSIMCNSFFSLTQACLMYPSLVSRQLLSFLSFAEHW